MNYHLSMAHPATMWCSASRQDAAELLVGGAIDMLMHDGPYGFGLYLIKSIPEDRSDYHVALQFALSDDIVLSCRSGWEPAAELPFPDEEWAGGDGVIAVTGSEIVCLYNALNVRLVGIVCA